MKEIGGYIELDSYNHPMLHEGAIALNCGRNALAYILRSRKIKKLKLPFFICNSIIDVCKREEVRVNYYNIGKDFRPMENLVLAEDEWIYIVNFYGQLSNDIIQGYVDKYKRILVDQANGYFEPPLSGVDTLYTCRKWFGVADGAFLYTDALLQENFPQDESFDRMRFLLGRFEKGASDFYDEYKLNNLHFAKEPIKRMSKLTHNLLHAIDYYEVKKRRSENVDYLHSRLGSMNLLNLRSATFMYPLMVENGCLLRSKLAEKKIYIPTLWPSVFAISSPGDLEYNMAENILPLPIDQRYGLSDMDYIADHVIEHLKG